MHGIGEEHFHHYLCSELLFGVQSIQIASDPLYLYDIL